EPPAHLGGGGPGGGRRGRGERSGTGQPDGERAVVAERGTAQVDLVGGAWFGGARSVIGAGWAVGRVVALGDLGEGGDRGAAPGLQLGEQGPFGDHGQARERVVQGRQRLHERGVGGAALDGQGALRRGGQHEQRVEDLGDLVGATQAGDAGAGQHDRVQLAVADLAQPGVDVAPDRYALEPEAERRELGDAPGGAGTDARAAGQLGQGAAAGGDQGFAGVLARRDGGDGQAVHGGGGQVLVRVDGEVDLLGGERVTQRGDEHPDAEAGDRRGRLVPGGTDLDQIDPLAGGRGHRFGDEPRLGQRQRAAPRPQLHRARSSGSGGSGLTSIAPAAGPAA